MIHVSALFTYRESLVVNNNLICHNMSPTEYDTDILFFLKQFKFFWHHAFRSQILHLWNATVASLEHKCHIFETQLPNLWNTTATSLEPSMLAVWKGV